MDLDAECVVCYEPTDDSLSPCRHKVCRNCSLRFLESSSSCPYCKRFVCGIAQKPNSMAEKVKVSFKDPDLHAGFTARMDAEDRVVIAHLHPNDQFAASGVKIGSILIDVNGIPAKNAAQVVEVVEQSRRCGCDVDLVLETPRVRKNSKKMYGFLINAFRKS